MITSLRIKLIFITDIRKYPIPQNRIFNKKIISIYR
jgi:hypothetical protein